MRYADYAYEHINSDDHKEKDSGRAGAIDRRAERAGFSNGADYLDDVMGRPDTRSFEGANGRTAWVNAEERLTGWNHAHQPEQSTVIPARDSEVAEKRFEDYKETEADKLKVDKEQIEERGAILEQDRQVPNEIDKSNEPPQHDQEPAREEPERAPERQWRSTRDIFAEQEQEWDLERDR